MEQLIIFLLIAAGSAISSYLQKKKKREAEEAERDFGRPAGEQAPPQWPATPRDWQEELRRMLQGEAPSAPPSPPPAPALPPKLPGPAPVVRRSSTVPPPLIEREISEGALVLPSPLKESGKAHARASSLQARVEHRLHPVDAQTTAHSKPPVGSAPTVLQRFSRSPESLREAFIASLIFSPPVALSEPRDKAWS